MQASRASDDTPGRRTTLDEFDHPDSLWNRAAAATEHGDPFCTRTEWQLSFAEAFEPPHRLQVFADGGNVVALAELDAPTPVAAPLDCHWLFGCPLLGERACELLAKLRAVGAPLHGHRVAIGGLAGGGALAQQILRVFGGRCEIRLVKREAMVSASLAGGLDGYLGRRSAKLRRGLRHSMRRAVGRGVTFERQAPRSAADAAAVYARMLAVEAVSWKGLGRCGMAESPSREFYAAMLRRLAVSGAGRVIFARHGERDIGFIFGGLAGTVYRGQQFSHADDWQAESIGNLLQFEQLRWLGEEQATRYDMGPQMEYKRHWTEQQIQLETWLLQPI